VSSLSTSDAGAVGVDIAEVLVLDVRAPAHGIVVAAVVLGREAIAFGGLVPIV
jgi:hypothetical protein